MKVSPASDRDPAGRACAIGKATSRHGFTLLEVMIALAVVAIAMLALLALDRQDLESVIRTQDLSRAAMLAQALMTQVEMQVASGSFPDSGTTSGDFQSMYRGQYPNFRWEKTVEPAELFPDVRKVAIAIQYGPGFGRRFEVVEFMHNPQPPPVAQGQASGPAQIPLPGGP